jgi:phage terminase large subunit GpA-like protein
MYEERKHDPERLKVFINTVDAQCYEDPNEKLDWEDVKSRAEKLPAAPCPRGTCSSPPAWTCRKDRLEYLVMAWGRGMRRFVIVPA